MQTAEYGFNCSIIRNNPQLNLIKAALCLSAMQFFCAACLLLRSGGDEPRDGRLTKRKGVVQQAKRRETQDAGRRLTKALGRTRRGNLCRSGAVESGTPAS